MKRLIVSFFVLTNFTFATTINVPADSSTIQGGINGAVDGDTVLVAAGTYVENITWPATNGIKLIGSGEEDCIVDGNSLASVIHFDEDLGGIIDATTLITGFTIQNGYAGKLALGWIESSAYPVLYLAGVIGMFILSFLRMFHVLSPLSFISGFFSILYNLLSFIAGNISRPPAQTFLPPGN